MSKTRIVFRCSWLAALIIFSSVGISAQGTKPTDGKHRIWGKVVDSGNNGLEKVQVWVEDESGRRLGDALTKDVPKQKGEYSISFMPAAKIKIFYGNYDNFVVDLSGLADHQLTRVVANIATGRMTSSDQGGTDAASLEIASGRSCQTQYLQLGNPK